MPSVENRFVKRNRMKALCDCINSKLERKEFVFSNDELDLIKQGVREERLLLDLLIRP